MKKAIIYHWWSELDDTQKVAQNLRVPTVLSIATFRAYNKYTKIYVLDGTEHEADWGDFPEVLNFSVLKWKLGLQQHRDKPGWNYLARLMDIHKFSYTCPEEEFVYCDSDVFWFQDLFPLNCQTNRFCYNFYNTGFFYWNKYCDEFFQLFNAYCTLCLTNEKIRTEIKSIESWDYWHYIADETICRYICENHQNIYNKIPYEEHGILGEVKGGRVSVNALKMLHCNGLMVPHPFNSGNLHCRGMMCLYIKEFYEAIRKTLGEERIKSIYTPEEFEYGLQHQMTMKNKDFVNAVQAQDTTTDILLYMDRIIADYPTLAAKVSMG